MKNRRPAHNPAFDQIDGEIPSADPTDPKAMEAHRVEMHRMIDEATHAPESFQYAVMTVGTHGEVSIDGTLSWEMLFTLAMSLANRDYVMAIVGGALTGRGTPEGAWRAIFDGTPFDYDTDGVGFVRAMRPGPDGEWEINPDPIPQDVLDLARRQAIEGMGGGTYSAAHDLDLDGSLAREGEDAESVRAENDVAHAAGAFHPADANHDGVVDEAEMARWLDDGAGAAPGAAVVSDDFTPSEDNEAIADALSDTRASADGMPETEDAADDEFPSHDADRLLDQAALREEAMVVNGDLDDAGDFGDDTDIDEMLDEDGPDVDLSPLDAPDEQDKG